MLGGRHGDSGNAGCPGWSYEKYGVMSPAKRTRLVDSLENDRGDIVLPGSGRTSAVTWKTLPLS
jgi:hypothetical protein